MEKISKVRIINTIGNEKIYYNIDCIMSDKKGNVENGIWFFNGQAYFEENQTTMELSLWHNRVHGYVR